MYTDCSKLGHFNVERLKNPEFILKRGKSLSNCTIKFQFCAPLIIASGTGAPGAPLSVGLCEYAIVEAEMFKRMPKYVI